MQRYKPTWKFATIQSVEDVERAPRHQCDTQCRNIAQNPPNTLSPSLKVVHLVWLLEFGTAWLTAVSARHGTVCPHPTSQRSIRENPEWPKRPDNWHGFAAPPSLPRKFILNVCCFVWGWDLCLKALGSSKGTVRFTWHVAKPITVFFLCIDGFNNNNNIILAILLYLFMVYLRALSGCVV